MVGLLATTLFVATHLDQPHHGTGRQEMQPSMDEDCYGKIASYSVVEDMLTQVIVVSSTDGGAVVGLLATTQLYDQL